MGDIYNDHRLDNFGHFGQVFDGKTRATARGSWEVACAPDAALRRVPLGVWMENISLQGWGQR